MDIPGYDNWKTSDPDEDRCEFCGIHARHCRDGWQPDCCTGECRRSWRDPDYERDQRIEDERTERDLPRGWDD